MVRQVAAVFEDDRLTSTGITPFVKPDDLKFYFEEIHRLTK
jgi:hypothetical protein